jgi:hypothetical protein
MAQTTPLLLMGRLARVVAALSLLVFGVSTPGEVFGSTFTLVGGNLNPTPESGLLENKPPVATDLTLEHHTQSPLSIPLSGLATDPELGLLTFTVTTLPAFGTASIEGSAVVYTPSNTYLEGDTFKVQARDSWGATAESTVTLTNHYAPVAGTYFGLLGTRGVLSVTITPFAIVTYKVSFDGQSKSGVVAFNQGGTALFGIGVTPIRLTFPTTNPAGLIATAELSSVPVVTSFCKKGVPADFVEPFVGQYNISLNVAGEERPYGFAKVLISSDGTVRAKGRLSNGKTWTAGSRVGDIGDIAIAVRLSRDSQLSGELIVPPRRAFSGTVDGAISWNGSFGTRELQVHGARFTKQEFSGRNIFGTTRIEADFIINSPALRRSLHSGTSPIPGGLDTGLTYRQDAKVPLSVNGQNRVTQLRAAPPLVALAIKNDGRFSGTFVSSTGRWLQVRGVFITDAIHGVGFVTAGSSGYVLVNDPNAEGSATQTTTTGTTATDSGGLTKTGTGTVVIAGSDSGFNGNVVGGGSTLAIDSAGGQ